ncbi:isopenicillin N synthase family oxygenase [Lichenicola cladoniae]|uniref:2-oxoglutarate-dependent ethylene/succinate-forming enzyme n=1 Tax=Lichenicola cladoniae TaxID=1484109 RepID=A0A6M8GYP7_9PROT|nr:isopenicillin N synthase family oxygenase [Lichenicola cladoniae]NPD65289.1 isopenicillin N synthase family oxygenase [Acetobacteraceae bacterium]QKE88874.1 isopenicillin N synthase family oxygenase [Lichenicola cladoniae]
MDRIPTLDLRRLDSDRDAFVAELGASYRHFGFCCFSHHGIDDTLIADAYGEFARFFALPTEAKSRYTVTAPGGGGRGYIGFRVETARTSDIADLKEFYHIGRNDGPPDDPVLRPNVWPEQVEGFRAHGLALFGAMEAAGQRVLTAIALDLGLEPGFFAQLTNRGDSILRALHYPPIAPEHLPAVRAEAHEDISLITLLVGATASGLEVLTREGAWLPIDAEPGTLVVNVGDMMQRLTNQAYPSTTHRVVNPTGDAARRSRYSMPFFLAPNMDYLIETLPGCIGRDGNHYPEPITAHDYLLQRLREIRLQTG